jgi:hypothetical protein
MALLFLYGFCLFEKILKTPSQKPWIALLACKISIGMAQDGKRCGGVPAKPSNHLATMHRMVLFPLMSAGWPNGERHGHIDRRRGSRGGIAASYQDTGLSVALQG